MPADDASSFAVVLRRLREAASLSQEELAERAGLTAKAVGALERGERRRPYPTTVRALGGALGLDETGLAALADAARTPAAATATHSGDAVDGIPAPPTPLIGRDRERREVGALLTDGGARLVTLTGPGGVGKTRIAWDVARSLDRQGSVTVPVDLVPIRSVELVLPTIARALGVRVGSDDLIALVASVIGDAERLVVLDNVEHVIEAATIIATLLSHCAGLRVLATSRAPLRIRSEQEYPIRPLEVPTDGEADVVLASPAGRLFVERARAVAPGLVLDRETGEAIAAICRRLDGLPLAIELAAAHVRYVSPSRLIDRLDGALAADRLRDMPERQRTMQATMDWSLALCTDDERRLLGALTHFAGGFDRAAVAAVAGRDVVDAEACLDGLVEQSLVVALDPDATGEARYRLLEPIRNHAANSEPVARSEEIARRHADHFAGLCSAARSGLRGMDQSDWLDLLGTEHANLGLALEHLTGEGDAGRSLDVAARIAADVWLYWALRGHAAEGRRWTTGIVAAPEFGRVDPAARAAGLVGSCGIHLATGDHAAVIGHAREAAALARGVGDDRLLGEALVLLGLAMMFEGDGENAAAAVTELEAVAARRGDGWLSAHALAARGQLLIVQGELAAAAEPLGAAEAIARSEAGPFTLAMVLNVAATLARLEADDGVAFDRLSEAATIAAEVGTTWTLVYTLPGLAGVARRRGADVLAAMLFAAGAAIAERSMIPVSFGPDAEAAAAQVEAVRRRLAPEVFAEAWERGRDIGPEGVVGLLARFTSEST